MPGTVQKIAFDQVSNAKVAMIYRILKDTGYLYRVRIYDLKKFNCEAKPADDEVDQYYNVASSEDIDSKFDLIIKGEKFYLKD